jgi:hypothetical protein
VTRGGRRCMYGCGRTGRGRMVEKQPRSSGLTLASVRTFTSVSSRIALGPSHRT